MIPEFVQSFEDSRDDLEFILRERHPEGWEEFIELIVSILKDNWCLYGSHCAIPETVSFVGSSSREGTLVCVISSEFLPVHWYVAVDYGSVEFECRSDPFLDIRMGQTDEQEKPSECQVAAYMGLALRIVKGVREIEVAITWGD